MRSVPICNIFFFIFALLAPSLRIGNPYIREELKNDSWKRELPAFRKAISGRLKQSAQVLQEAPGGRLPYTSVQLAGMLDFVTRAHA